MPNFTQIVRVEALTLQAKTHVTIFVLVYLTDNGRCIYIIIKLGNNKNPILCRYLGTYTFVCSYKTVTDVTTRY